MLTYKVVIMPLMLLHNAHDPYRHVYSWLIVFVLAQKTILSAGLAVKSLDFQLSGPDAAWKLKRLQTDCKIAKLDCLQTHPGSDSQSGRLRTWLRGQLFISVVTTTWATCSVKAQMQLT